MDHEEFEDNFNAFVESLVHGEIYDRPSTPGAERSGGRWADYLFFNGWIVAELKSCEKDFAAELQRLAGEFIEEHRLAAYGEFPFSKLGELMPHGPALNERAATLTSGPVQKHLKKSNRQIRETKARLGRDQSFGLLILANLGNSVLQEDLVHFVLANAIADQRAGQPKYSAIDAVWYMSLSSAPEGRTLTSTVTFRGQRPEYLDHLGPAVEQLIKEWAAFNEIPYLGTIVRYEETK